MATPAAQPHPHPPSQPPPQPQPPPTTVPCAYRTGRVLGQGTYAVVKEAQRISDGQLLACKVISKKLMAGREHMIRQEIQSLKRVSQHHPHIVTLVDYFETLNNLYLVTDLCTGGELFDRICDRGNYYEKDAAHLVRVVTEAVKYLHDQGIVHRDLKPENLLFRDKSENADLLIADFGLSRVVDGNKLTLLSTTCGTPGYMAPEIFKKTGHSFPVDMWALGVITYFLLCGYTPFDRDSSVAEMAAIVSGDYSYEPAIYWEGVSNTARDFIDHLLVVDPAQRMTADEALAHPWLVSVTSDTAGEPEKDLLPGMKTAFNAKRTFRKAVHGIRLMNRLKSVTQEHQRQIAQAEAQTQSETGGQDDIAAIQREIQANESEETPENVLVQQ